MPTVSLSFLFIPAVFRSASVALCWGETSKRGSRFGGIARSDWNSMPTSEESSSSSASFCADATGDEGELDTWRSANSRRDAGSRATRDTKKVRSTSRI